jgi:hypothetical protein
MVIRGLHTRSTVDACFAQRSPTHIATLQVRTNANRPGTSLGRAVSLYVLQKEGSTVGGPQGKDTPV